MENAVQAKQNTNSTALVDRSYLIRLCEEIQVSFHERREKGIFSFLYRYFKTLLQQERFEELKMFLHAVEHHSFTSHTENVLAFVGYMKAFLGKSQGKLEEAAYWFRQTLGQHKQLEVLGIKNVRVDCYKELGNLDFYQEQYKHAIENYQAAINSLSLDQDNEYLLAILMYNLSLCQYYQKNYRQTLEYLDKVIPLAKDTSNSYLLLDSLTTKAVLLSDHFMKYEESNEYLDAAFVLAERNKHTESIHKIWNNWAHNFYHLKQYVLAEHALKYSINLSKEKGDLQVGLGSEVLQAEICMAQGQKQMAKKLLKSVKAKAAGDPQLVTEYLDCLGLLEQLEENMILRTQYVKEGLQLAIENNNYQKSTKFKKILKEIYRNKQEL